MNEKVGDWVEHFFDYWKRNYVEAKNWLREHPDTMHALGQAIEAARLCFVFIPPPAIVSEQDLGLTATTTEAMAAANASCALSFTGIYPQAFHSLRQALEMSVMCSFFLLDWLGSGRIRQWREGRIHSPRFSECIERISSKKHRAISIGAFTPTEYRRLYTRLSSWTHLHRAGHDYFFTSEDGHPYFDEDAFQDWAATCIQTLKLCIVTLLVTFPSYVLELPEWKIPDAWVGPWNWTFPKPEHTKLVRESVSEQLWLKLETLSDDDSTCENLRDDWRRSRPSSDDVEQ